MTEKNKKLGCSHERGNFYDRFTIKTTSGNGTTVNHLGGLEIVCTATARMPATVKNQTLIDRYQELVYERYAAPNEEAILGSFLVAAPRPLQRSAEKKKIETNKRATKTKLSKQKMSFVLRQMYSAMKQKGSITIKDKIVID